MTGLFKNGDTSKLLGVLGLSLGLALSQAPAADAQAAKMTVQSMMDRAQIEDLLTQYYYNFGHGSAQAFSAFYADDAELRLGAKVYKGKEGIEGAYNGVPADSPVKKAFSFTVLLTNPLVIVHGDTATAQVIFTEVLVDTPGATPHLLTQGREYDKLVKIKGQWKFRSRQIMAGTQEPDGWPN